MTIGDGTSYVTRWTKVFVSDENEEMKTLQNKKSEQNPTQNFNSFSFCSGFVTSSWRVMTKTFDSTLLRSCGFIWSTPSNKFEHNFYCIPFMKMVSIEKIVLRHMKTFLMIMFVIWNTFETILKLFLSVKDVFWLWKLPLLSAKLRFGKRLS